MHILRGSLDLQGYVTELTQGVGSTLWCDDFLQCHLPQLCLTLFISILGYSVSSVLLM